MKRSINLKFAAVLVFILLLLPAAACKDGGGAPETEKNTGGEILSVQEDPEEKTTEMPDNLPERDFDRYNFRIYMRDSGAANADLYAESEIGEPLNDAVYKRNKTIDERFNINIDFAYYPASEWNAVSAQKSILAGDDSFDIAAVHGAAPFVLSQKNVLLDFFENMPYINFEAPWWSDDIIKNLSAFGKLYCITGDISYASLDCTLCLLFNKDLFKELNIEYPYNDVINGTWTLDKFISIAKQGMRDIDGDGIFSPDADRYGFDILNDWAYPISVLYCGGDRVITIGEGGIPELTVYNERTVGIFDKFFNMINVPGAAYIRNGEMSMFRDGRSLFLSNVLSAIVEHRDMEDDIGILPNPKYDESTPKYYSNVDAGRNVFTVPVTATDTERTSIIVEALCAEGYRKVIPALYDVSLKTKHARDEESSVMIDYIKDGRVYDYGYFNTSVAGDFGYCGRNLLASNNANFTSFYEKNADKVQKNIDKLNNE
jgi:ABC-type glycerol-3-phosphate transport system substrate-binding protein